MSQSKPVTLKRSVSVKAVVTEKFKEFMKYEVKNAIDQNQTRIQGLQDNLQSVGKQLADSGDSSKLLPTYQQLEAEIYKLEANVAELNERNKGIDNLKLGSHFVQGLIDGFVQIKVGDNLYEKLGGLEILIEDGIIKDISTLKDTGPADLKQG